MKNKKVLVVSVHPDDETIGCGGTILKYKSDGFEVACMYITDGNKFQKRKIKELNKLYNFDNFYRLKFPEILLDDISLSVIIPKISKVFNEFKPNILYLPNRSDPHSDHRKTFEACQACIKSFRYPSLEKILMMEIISETDFSPNLPENCFIPNVFVDITNFYKQKINILKIFKSEILEKPFTRSISTMEAYNRYRGSQINVEYAESFMLVKEIFRE
tara:strand:- start:9339 stop:9989 length:651 start_codon:yes stop_codon:yes gene_type:complete